MGDVKWPLYIPDGSESTSRLVFSLKEVSSQRSDTVCPARLIQSNYRPKYMGLWNELIPNLLLPPPKKKTNIADSSFTADRTMEAMTTPSTSVDSNKTNERIDDPKNDKDEGIGIEITITLTIGLLLFIINGAAFLNLAWKKRIAQKQFRRNLEDQIRRRIETQHKLIRGRKTGNRKPSNEDPRNKTIDSIYTEQLSNHCRSKDTSVELNKLQKSNNPSIATTPKSDLKIDFDKAKTPDTSTSANYIKANSIKPNIIKHKVHETLTTTTVGLDKKPTLTTTYQSSTESPSSMESAATVVPREEAKHLSSSVESSTSRKQTAAQSTTTTVTTAVPVNHSSIKKRNTAAKPYFTSATKL